MCKLEGVYAAEREVFLDVSTLKTHTVLLESSHTVHLKEDVCRDKLIKPREPCLSPRIFWTKIEKLCELLLICHSFTNFQVLILWKTRFVQV